jgi:hypothetical protein
MISENYLTSILEKFNFEIYIIRHAQSLNNLAYKKYKRGTCYEKFMYRKFYKDPKLKDCKLTEQGILDSINIGSILESHNIIFDEIYSSPLNRCIETSYYALKNNNKNVIIDEKLREIIKSIGDYPENLYEKKKNCDILYSNLNYNFDNILEKYQDGNIIKHISNFHKNDFQLNLIEYEFVKKNVELFWDNFIIQIYKKYVIENFSDKKNIKIGIFSHCGFINLLEIHIIKYYFSKLSKTTILLDSIRPCRNAEIKFIDFSLTSKKKKSKKLNINNEKFKLNISTII